MALTLTVKGVSYTFPQVDDEDWGDQVTLWAQAVTGVIVPFLDTPTSPIAQTGVIALGNGDKISWRDNTNTNDAGLTLDNLNHLVMTLPDGSDIDLSTLGTGDVHGPSSAVDNSVARFDLTTGKLIQGSNVVVSDTDNVSGIDVLTANSFTSVIVGGVDVSKALIPIGTIIDHYDYNGALVPDSTYWKLCNGQNVTVGGLGTQTLPDASGRYIVGFGTDAGGDMASATWNISPVGRVGHLSVSIAHDHDSGDLKFRTATVDYVSSTEKYLKMYNTSGTLVEVGEFGRIYASGVNNGAMGLSAGADATFYTSNGTGDTGAMSTGLTTLDIQPRSIRCRKYMRVK